MSEQTLVERWDDELKTLDNFRLRVGDIARQLLEQGDVRIAELEAVVEKLPKTADGVTVVHGMVVYKGPAEPYSCAEDDEAEAIAEMNKHKDDLYPVGSELTMYLTTGYEGDIDASDCYSTRAAAEAAKAAKEGART